MARPKEGYKLADGTPCPGTTSIIGRFKDSGALIAWAWKRGKDGLDLYDSRDKAANIGTLAHAMVENFLTNKDPELALAEAKEDEKPKARQAYSAFQSWFAQTQANVISAELPLVSESLRFGGTPDCVLRMPDGRLALGDVKTSNGIYRDMLMQVAAYGYVWNETHEEQITGGYHIMRFSKDFPDFEHRYFAELDTALELFKLLRPAYDLDAQLKKRVA